MKYAGDVLSMGERKGAYRVLLGEPEGRRPLGRPRHIWEDNIKKDLKNRVGEWTESGRGSGQVAGSGEHGNEPLCFIKCGEFLD
jgi:hypothetical protein